MIMARASQSNIFGDSYYGVVDRVSGLDIWLRKFWLEQPAESRQMIKHLEKSLTGSQSGLIHIVPELKRKPKPKIKAQPLPKKPKKLKNIINIASKYI